MGYKSIVTEKIAFVWFMKIGVTKQTKICGQLIKLDVSYIVSWSKRKYSLFTLYVYYLKGLNKALSHKRMLIEMFI